MNNSTLVDKILDLRHQGIGMKSIATTLDVPHSTVRYYCRKNNLGGIKAKEDFSKREVAFANKINNSNIGFEYSKGYIHSDKPMWIKCKKCGHETKRSGISIRHAISGRKNIECEKCKLHEKNEKLKEEVVVNLRKSILKESINIVSSLKEIHIVRCKQCNELFSGSSREVYCSDKCRKRNDNKRKELMKRMRVKTARSNGSFDASISLEKLFKRDKGQCYLCGLKCNYEDYRITTDGHFIVGKQYPTIEHVLPLSKGGTHSWDNVKLACWECNTSKSNTLLNEDDNQISFYL